MNDIDQSGGRTEVSIRTGDGITVNGWLYLRDFSIDGVGLFAGEGLELGETVELVVDGPRQISLRGAIIWRGKSHVTTRVIRKHHFPLRIGIKFHLGSPGDREDIERFCREIAVTPARPEAPVKLPTAPSQIERRRAMLREQLLALCADKEASGAMLSALCPTEQELSEELVGLRERDSSPKWQRRVLEATEQLGELFGFIL